MIAVGEVNLYVHSGTLVLTFKEKTLILCEATARSTNLRKMQSLQERLLSEKQSTFAHYNHTLSECFYLSLQASVYLTLDHEKQIQQTNPNIRGTLKSLPKVVSKRSHQEEFVQSVKTAKCVAPCVASEALRVTDKLPNFPSKAELECT